MDFSEEDSIRFFNNGNSLYVVYGQCFHDISRCIKLDTG